MAVRSIKKKTYQHLLLWEVSVDATACSSVPYESLAAARNVGGTTGFSIWNIHQLGAIQTLALIEIGHPDVKTLIGNGGNWTTNPNNSNPQSLASQWRGIAALWGTRVQKVAGAKYVSGTLRLWNEDGSETFVDTGLPVHYGDVAGLSTAAGAGFDLKKLFQPTSGSSNYYSSHVNAAVIDGGDYYHGGAYFSGYGYVGLFSVGTPAWMGEGVNTIGTSRLAKI